MTSTPVHDDAPPSRWRRLSAAIAGRGFEVVTGLGILLISLVSLFVAFSANRTQERLLAASVWPHLDYATGNVDTGGVPAITFDLVNRGVGPARVHWAELSYRGEPVDFATLLRRCCGVADPAGTEYQTRGIERVIGADEWISFFRMPKAGNPAALWTTLDRERIHVGLRACYCSVLDDCWMLDSARDQPEPVAQCPAHDGKAGIARLPPPRKESAP